MQDKNFIIGLMRENYDALGFIPATTIETRYLANGLYVVQRDLRGRNTGYVLHGNPSHRNNYEMVISQAVIDYDNRNRGFGNLAVQQIVARAEQVNARRIRLSCADDLDANLFWQSIGFEHILIKNPTTSASVQSMSTS